jgi:predicted N-formylglutamate amidohydrolase
MSTVIAAPDRFLGPTDPNPFLVHGEGRHSEFVLVCDHGGNAVPRHLGSLGLTPGQLKDHIAWDPNAWEQTIALADLLGAKAIGQPYSRLVIDCNRRTAAPDSIAKKSDGVVVSGNVGISAVERRRRAQAILAPYHDRIERELGSYKPTDPVCIISMHTFTPRLMGGQPRPWHIGVMSGPDDRMHRRVIDRFERSDHGLTVGDNEPYVIKLDEVYTLAVHAENAGLPYVQFELRNDTFGDAESRGRVCQLLADAIRHAFDGVKAESPPAGRA